MDYKNGKIYTLRSYQTDDIYIGSSATTLTKRKSTHKQDYNKWKNGKKHYMTSYEIIKYDDCYIELLELFPCNSIDELKQREGHHQRSMECVNKRIECRTKKEYKIDNANKIKEQNKEYCIKNANNIKEKKKEYYIKNADKLKEKINCECGGKYTKQHLSTHQKSKRHQEYLETLATN
jgi:hypothetical protein